MREGRALLSWPRRRRETCMPAAWESMVALCSYYIKHRAAVALALPVPLPLALPLALPLPVPVTVTWGRATQVRPTFKIRKNFFNGKEPVIFFYKEI